MKEIGDEAVPSVKEGYTFFPSLEISSPSASLRDIASTGSVFLPVIYPPGAARFTAGSMPPLEMTNRSDKSDFFNRLLKRLNMIDGRGVYETHCLCLYACLQPG